MTIKEIHAREILDSRGNPTIEVEVILKNGVGARAAVPSGASTGKHEAVELRDGGKRFGGKGVLKAIKNVQALIGKKLAGMDVTAQKKIDQLMIELDGTKNKSRLGANAILGVSLACARAAAKYLCIPLYQYISQTYSLKPKAYSLPRLMLNLINGGRHAAWAFDIQEFMVVPKMNSLTESVRAGSEIFHTLGELLHEKGYSTLVGDEGGYAPEKNQKSKIKNQNYNEIPFQLLTTAAKKAGYKPGKNVFFAIDVAASEFYNSKTGAYELKKEKKNYTAKQLGVLYQSWIKKYPLILIEDPFGEDDWSAWERFNSQLPTPNSQPLVIGDDLFTTNIERLQQGIAMGAANSILIKPNQIGTLTETVECVKVAKKYGMKIVISHRSGETSDSFISDLSVAVSADYIKAGAPSRGERVAKYNRLMEIEQELND